MQIINYNQINLESEFIPIDDSIIINLAQIAFNYKKETKQEELRKKLYKSIYYPRNLQAKEQNLETFLEQLSSHNVKTKNQHYEYKWIGINDSNISRPDYRFYIAPNPNNLHELVKQLVQTFMQKNVSIRFKYQLTSNMECCDRIIIYVDYNNKTLVEESIKSVYESSPKLFHGYERSSAWLYKTSIPGVFLTKETIGDAYSNIIADIIKEAKETFDFLYKITDFNPNIILTEKEMEKAIQDMQLLIHSIMFRKGILLKKGGDTINIKDKNVKARYDYATGILEHHSEYQDEYYSVKFYPTKEGRQALLENFYNVSQIEEQIGLDIRHLTLRESQEEKRTIYPHLNKRLKKK